jgi:hypothetical protein
VRRAREQGLSLTGPDGLLKQLTKAGLETALDQEMTEHLGREKHSRADVPGRGPVCAWGLSRRTVDNSRAKFVDVHTRLWLYEYAGNVFDYMNSFLRGGCW